MQAQAALDRSFARHSNHIAHGKILVSQASAIQRTERPGLAGPDSRPVRSLDLDKDAAMRADKPDLADSALENDNVATDVLHHPGVVGRHQAWY